MKALGFEITFAEVEKVLHSWIFRLVCLVGIILFGCMAFGPESIVQRLQLDGFRKWLGPWLGVLFILCSVLWVGVWGRQRWLKHQTSRLYKGKDADERIARLSPVARACLYDMYLRPDRAGHYEMDNPTFLEMCNAQAVWSPLSGDRFHFPCYLQHWVVEWLDKHPEVMDRYTRNTGRGEME